MDGFDHQSCPGLLFYRSNNFDIVSTFKLNFTNNLPHENLCVTTIVVLSEARNLELYVNGEYEKSVKGRRRMNEEKLVLLIITMLSKCVLTTLVGGKIL